MAEETAPRPAIKFTIDHINENVSTITFTDDMGKSTAYYIEPSNLNLLLPALLQLVVRWSKHPHLKPETFSGDRKFLVAQHIELDKGRDERELAVRIYVGEIQFSFLLPLDSLNDAVGTILPRLKPIQ